MNVSVSSWVTLKSGFECGHAKKDDRVIHFSKVQIFNQRCELQKAEHVPSEDLQNLSFYAFWRLFSVRSGRLSRRQREAIVSLTGTGWPSHAQRTHAQHLYYARHTLYAYMPCQGNRGTDYIDECVDRFYEGNWADALRAFVTDVDNLWCPKWIRRNYEVQNKIDVLTKEASEHPQDAADVVCKKCVAQDTEKNSSDVNVPFPHAEKFKTELEFHDGEPDVNEEDDRPESYECQQWKNENREPWQLHSSLGPNLKARGTKEMAEPVPEVVNPPGHQWQTFHSFFRDSAPDTFWQKSKSLNLSIPICH